MSAGLCSIELERVQTRTLIQELRETRFQRSDVLYDGDARGGPRLHDLRYFFAVQRMLQWYRIGVNVEAHLAELSDYLAHGHVRDTYWYLSVMAELLQLASERCRGSQRTFRSTGAFFLKRRHHLAIGDAIAPSTVAQQIGVRVFF